MGDIMEVSWMLFSISGADFDVWLRNLEKFLIVCKETNLALSWEKFHFMVQNGIILGHKVSMKGIEVDRAKIVVIETLPPPNSIHTIRRFLGYVGFYRRFIKDFSKIAKPLTRLLEKDVSFNFTKECLEAFECLKEKLVNSLVVIALDWFTF